MLKLYNSPTSTCSVKVRVGLAEMGLDYESHLIDLQKGDQRDPDYLKLNPNGVVPTLVDGDLVVIESSLILEYLDREYNDGRLMPSDRDAGVAARLWLLRCLVLHDATNSLSFSTSHRDRTLATKSADEIAAMLAKMSDPVKREKRKDLLENGVDSIHVEQALEQLRRAFDDMTSVLEKSAWMTGADLGIADVAIVSYIDRVERLGFEGLWTDTHPRVGDWLAAMQARSSYQTEVKGKIEPAVADKIRSDGSNHWPALENKWNAG